jgi:capsular exopolysaccharide synthesis family protein
MTGYSLPPREPSEALVQQPSQVPAAPLDYDLSGLQTPDDGGGIPWRRYLSALKRYRWLILLVMVAGTGIGVFATRFLKQEYMVQATIFIESPPSKEGPMRSEGFVEGGNWVELVTTFTVLDSVVAKERLYLTYPPKDSTLFASFGLLDRFRPGQYVLHVDDAGKRFTLKSAEGLLIQSGRAGDSVGTRVGFRWTPTPAQVASAKSRDVTFGVTSPRDASMALRDQLTTRMEERGNFLRLILTGNDPARLTSTMNTLINQYVEVAAELKKRKLAELSKVLAQQVDTVGKQLKDAETRLEGFKVRTITQPTENAPIAAGLQTTTPTAMTRYFEQKVQIDQLEHDRQALEQVLRQTQSGQLSVDAFNTIPAAHNAPDLNKTLAELSQAEADLRALQTRYTDEYKPVRDLKQRIQTIRSQTIPAYTEALIRGMRRQENDLRAQVSSGSRELQQIPNRTITEQRLTREVQSIAAIYTDLQQRFEAARLAEASAIPDVRILDPAIMPERPVSDQAPRVILMAFLLSTALAFGLAILLDQLDKRFRYPEQVTHELGLSIFGAIPAIRHMRSGKADLEEASQVVEAFRTIRLNLVHSYGTGPVLVTISSPGPGDGKSLVSSNLALSFAEAGYKTLLVDGDIRRGELHRMFGTERIPGLIDYLARKAGIDDVLRATSHQNLALLPCGTRRHHGPELLGSGMMSELIGEMKSRFNVIIVDSPPLGAGIDPFVLGTATGNIMLVLRSGETNRRMAEAKVRLLDRLPIRVLGAVLNDIRTSESVYQHYSYVYGYVADEEKMPKLGDGGGA